MPSISSEFDRDERERNLLPYACWIRIPQNGHITGPKGVGQFQQKVSGNMYKLARVLYILVDIA